MSKSGERWFDNPYKFFSCAAVVVSLCAGSGVAIAELSKKGPQVIRYPENAKYIGKTAIKTGTTLLGASLYQDGAAFLFSEHEATEIRVLDCDGGKKIIDDSTGNDLVVSCLLDDNRKLELEPIK